MNTDIFRHPSPWVRRPAVIAACLFWYPFGILIILSREWFEQTVEFIDQVVESWEGR